MSRYSASVGVRSHARQDPTLLSISSSAERKAVAAEKPIARRQGFERIAPSLLAELLTAPIVRIIDVRRHPQSLPSPYATGHIPGAVWLDVDSVLDSARRRPRSLLEFAAAMAPHGVGDENLVVLYDEGKYGTASALARAMVNVGHRTVGVLVGGWERWTAAGQAIEQTTRRYPPASFTARRRSRS